MVLGFCTKPIFGHMTLHLRIINNQECQLASWIPVQFWNFFIFFSFKFNFFYNFKSFLRVDVKNKF